MRDIFMRMLPHKALVDALQILETREKASTSLSHYARLVVEVLPAEHHELICSHIDQLLDDEFDELIINSPPGSAKSTYTSHALPAYFMGKFPTKNIILATHTADLSERWSRKVRSSVEDPRHALVFPHSKLSQDSKAVSRWATSKGGEVLAAGVGGSILGFRADLGILDDPISGFEQAQSASQLTKIHNWYETDFVTRLKPGAKTVLICQRLSPNDLAGYLIHRNIQNPTKRQKLLVLRMAAEEDDPLGRPLGARLWPEWYTPEMMADAQRDDFKWKTLYQQRPPSEEGSWVSTEDIQFRAAPVNPEVTYGMSDLALSVNSGDYTVHFIVAVDSNGDWDILEASRKRVDIEVSCQEIVRLCQAYSPREWLVDNDNIVKSVAPLVATKARESGTFVPWKMLPMRGQDKETRNAPLRGMFKRRKVYMPADAPFAGWFTNELLTFPNALGDGVDDGVDSLGLLGRRMLAVSGPQLAVVPKARPTQQEMTLDQLFEDMPQTGTYRRM